MNSRQILKKFNKLYYHINSLYPTNVECNICGHQAKYFNDNSWHPKTICWKCHSEIRHRLLIAALTYIDQLSFANLVKGKKLLHFAPEPILGNIYKKYVSAYLTADITSQKTDIQLDISNMSKIKSNEFDLVIACDVLEHVKNDHDAIREIYRILSKGGYAILTVPQKDHLENTFEDPAIITAEDRERVFGQSDHLRIYGNDFSEKLKICGFQVNEISSNNFSEELIHKHVLFPPILSLHPLATNYRKIYFASKK